MWHFVVLVSLLNSANRHIVKCIMRWSRYMWRAVLHEDGRRALIPLCLFHLAFFALCQAKLSPQLAAQTAPGAQHIWIGG